MKLYAGIDLHSNNSYVVLLDDTDKVIYQKRLPNDPKLILEAFEPYREQIVGIVVESTYNWYWLVDQLMEAGYKIHLANVAGIQSYNGLKHTNDKTDAIWLAKLLRLGLLAEGHIYPKEKRGMRELLRRRLVLVRQQTMSVLGVQAMITRYENVKISAAKIKGCKKDPEEILKHIKDESVKIAAQSQLKILHCVVEQIAILAMTILLETGNINRFDQDGNYSSYCRCVESKRVSNAKKKGENNRKNGNAYWRGTTKAATSRHINECYFSA